MSKAIQEVRAAMTRAATSPSAEATKQLQGSRRRHKKAVKEAKNRWIMTQVGRVNGNPKAAWDAIKALQEGMDQAKVTPANRFQNKKGELSKTPEETAETVKEHFQGLLNKQKTIDYSILRQIKQRQTMWEMNDPPARTEVATALRKLKNGKATSNKIPAELYKALSHHGQALTELHNMIRRLWPKPTESKDAENDGSSTSSANSPHFERTETEGASFSSFSSLSNSFTSPSTSRVNPPHVERTIQRQKGRIMQSSSSTSRESSERQKKTGTSTPACSLQNLRPPEPNPERDDSDTDSDSEREEEPTKEEEEQRTENEARTAARVAEMDYPAEWNTTVLKMLPKKGDLTNLGNCRGIMLFDVAAQLMGAL